MGRERTRRLLKDLFVFIIFLTFFYPASIFTQGVLRPVTITPERLKIIRRGLDEFERTGRLSQAPQDKKISDTSRQPQLSYNKEFSDKSKLKKELKKELDVLGGVINTLYGDLASKEKEIQRLRGKRGKEKQGDHFDFPMIHEGGVDKDHAALLGEHTLGRLHRHLVDVGARGRQDLLYLLSLAPAHCGGLL